MTLGRSSGSKWHSTASRTMVRSSSTVSASVKIGTPRPLASKPPSADSSTWKVISVLINNSPVKCLNLSTMLSRHEAVERYRLHLVGGLFVGLFAMYFQTHGVDAVGPTASGSLRAPA